MKVFKAIVISVCAFMITACSTTTKFPVSRFVPAADISATKKTDSNNNYMLEVTSRNLASADRLNPSGNNYSIWIVTNEQGIKNVGQLDIRNAAKSTFKTSTPFDFNEIFITVEDQGDLSYPTGREIARTKI